MLSFFVVLCCVLLPYKKWWDGISIPLLSFSVFYAGIVLYKGENPGWSFIFSMLFAPTAFYRLGRFLMKTIQIEAQRQKILIYIIGTYLLPLFLLTAQDMALTGLINDSRNMLLDTGEDGSLNATLYGMMASIGIGCIGAVFSKQQNRHRLRCLFLARLKGFEPLTLWFVAKYSIQLSYKRIFYCVIPDCLYIIPQVFHLPIDLL